MRESRDGRPERHARLKTLFLRVIELDEAARGPFLDAECGGDAGLRADLESLLEHHLASDRQGGALDD